MPRFTNPSAPPRLRRNAADSRKFKRRRRFVPALEPLEDRITPTFYMVDSLADVVAADGQLTLREAVNAANTNAASGDAVAGSSIVKDVIAFDPSLAGKTIKLGGSDFDITDDVVIEGFADNPITIDAQGDSRHFYVFAHTTTIDVEISGLRLVNGSAAVAGSILIDGERVTLRDIVVLGNSANFSGGIYATGSSTVSIDNSTVSDNSADSGGGISAHSSTVSIGNSTVSGNSAIFGGGIYASALSTVTIDNSVVSDNNSGIDGGGIYAISSSTVTIGNSTVSDNNADSGGGIYANSSTVTIDNSTVSGNDAGARDGGGIYAVFSSTVRIGNSTVSDNNANDNGGSIYANSSTVTIDNSTVSGSNSDLNGGGIYAKSSSTVTIDNSTVSGNSSNSGGGIYANKSTVTIDNSTVSDNSANLGGGIYAENSSTVTIDKSTGSGNSAGEDGGGIYAAGFSTTVSIDNSTVSGNSAGDDGGGIYDHSSTVTIDNSTVSGNTAASDGGGIYALSSSTVTIDNSTVSGNRASFSGGGILVLSNSTVNLHHATIALNSAGGLGGGFYNTNIVNAENTIIGRNSAGIGPDVYGIETPDIFNLSYSLIQDISSIGAATLNETTPGSNIFGQDPLLRPLADNGGPTLTHALVEFSPAIDAGDPNFTPPPGSDQRGFPRIVNGRTDMGAVEHGGELRLFAGLLGDNRIVLFNADDPSQIDKTLTVTGLDAGDTLIGIDVRPADGLLYGVGKRNRIYRIDLATGQATKTAAMTIGLADGEAMAFDENLGLTDKILGLYRDSVGYYQGSFGSPVKWVRGEDNPFGNPWYFITPEGDFYAWDGQLSATGQLLHSFGSNVFKVPELLVFASTAQLPVDQQDDAQNFDNNLGLYVAAAGVYEDALQPGVKWLRGVNNSFGNPWYIIKNTGDFLEWDGNPTATGNLLFTFDPLLYRHPELLYDASTAQLPAAEQDDARNFDETLGLYVDSQGFYQGNDGNSVKWLRGKVDPVTGSPWYYIDIQGDFYKSNPTSTDTLLFDFDPLLFRHPELLYEASQLQLNAGDQAQAEFLDKTFGLYRFQHNYFEGSGGVKWLRGEPNSFGNVWFFIRPNGEFVEWNGTSTDGNVLATFTSQDVFLHPQLIHEAFQPVLSPNFFGDTTEAGVDFDPVDDTLRVITDNGQNLEVNVDTGETTAHPQIQDVGGGIADFIAAAYSNNYPGVPASTLYNIDASRDVLTRQDPDDSGVNANVGSLDLDAGPVGGFDILGDDLGYAALANGSSRLYAVDLNTGAATDMGKIGDDLMIYSLAALSPNLYAQGTQGG